MTNYILIAGSYWVFFRYHALLSWWRLRHKDVKIDKPIENEEFVNKFKKLFIEKIREIPKKLKLDNPVIIIGKDCPRKDIWRNEYTNNYKGTRKNDNNVGDFFKLAYNNLFLESGAEKILFHEKLEADDCIAIATRHYLKDENNKITIITSDTDYLQLIEERVNIYNGKLKPIRNKTNSTMDSRKDLFIKVVIGDKSDNISGVFEKCGKVKAKKYYDNPELFKKDMEMAELFDDIKARYERNQLLIDFNKIPSKYQEELLSKI